MQFMKERERQTLALICETLAPSLKPTDGDDPVLFRTGALDLNIPELLETALYRVTDEQLRSDLRQVMKLLEFAPANGLGAGQWGKFSNLDQEGRTAVLRAWCNSRFPLARQAFQSLKRLTLFLTYAVMPDDKPNPTWDAFHFATPPHPQNGQPRSITPVQITDDSTLDTEVLIVGSGAGGGVLAGELTAAGHDVIVLEKGGYHNESDFDGREIQSSERLFEKYASLTTDDISMIVMAGSTLGGGTTVNWMASLRTPDYVLDEWEHEYGFTGAASPEFQASLNAVSERINVNTEESIPNRQNALLEQGCRALGYDVHVIPRNVKGCEECGFCNFGCPFGAKQGTLKTYLQDAHDRGARIVVNAHADRITHQAGKVTGALVTVQNADGTAHKLTIKAKAVILAAGSVHTPAVLLRSGLKNPNIGANLRLHPVTTTTGHYPEAVRVWQGPPMTRLFKSYENMDGRGYGYRIEVPPAHPGIIAATLPWQSGQQHRRLMQNIDHYASFLVIVRDYHSGYIKLDRSGQPVIHYDLHRYDAKHMQAGILEALRIHRAAGATTLYSPHTRYLPHQVNGQAEFDAYLKRVAAAGLKPNTIALFSAHQMSSCHIAGDPVRGAVKPNGETYEIQNLFVTDASAMPTSTGVNPMISIMATAHFLAQRIKVQL